MVAPGFADSTTITYRITSGTGAACSSSSARPTGWVAKQRLFCDIPGWLASRCDARQHGMRPARPALRRIVGVPLSMPPSSLAAGQVVGPIDICRISPSLLPQDVGDLPSPTEGSVELRRQPGGHFAAVSFSGRAEEEQARRRNHLLLSLLDLHSAIKSCICYPGSLRRLQNSLATASLVHAQLETLVERPTKKSRSLMSVRRCSRSCGGCGRRSRRTA